MLATHLLSILQFLCYFSLICAAPSPSNYLSVPRSSDCIIQFTINLTWENYSPVGGLSRYGILVNGTSPGPALHMRVGDTVEFLVHNNLPFATAIHFHGISQLNTPWSDGVPGLSQRSIAAGQSFLYKWTADEYGVYFYHAHVSPQIMDGLFGAIVIEPPDDQARPFSLISSDPKDIALMEKADKITEPVFINDWTLKTSVEFMDEELAGFFDNYCVDAVLVNGKGSIYCLSQDEQVSLITPPLEAILVNGSTPNLTQRSCLPFNNTLAVGGRPLNTDAIPPDVCTPSVGPNATIEVDAEAGWASLSFISTAGIDPLEVSIDSHKMYVYAADGRYIEPQVVDAITVLNGERYSVMIKLDQPIGQYTIRVANSGIIQLISGFATLSYAGSTGPNPNAVALINYAGTNLTAITVANSLVVPFENVPPAPVADTTFFMEIENIQYSYKWTLSGTESFNLSANTVPLLFDKDQPLAHDSGLVISTLSGHWVDLIIRVAGPLGPIHAIHKHSKKAYIIGQGEGPFPWASVADAIKVIPQNFNLVNPPLRDGFQTPPALGSDTWLAVRYQVVNPGAFLLHCHLQTHLFGGMAMAILDGVDNWPVVPPEYLNATTAGYPSGNGIPK